MTQKSSLIVPFPSSNFRWTYDVFLSFRGEDVRKTFVDHLYTVLEQKGINTFKDDEKLERGKSISPHLEIAIEESRIALIIFSKNYANSTWCLDEVVKIIECKNVKGQIVLPVFYDVDPSTVKKQKFSFGEAFSNHETYFKGDDKVQKWRTALEEAANLSGWDLPTTANGHEARVIKQIVEDIIAKLGVQTHASNAQNLVGMDSRMQKVYKMLVAGSGGVRFVGIWGMSGTGKTTLARAMYDNISSQFEGACFLHEVRDRSAKQGLERLQEILLSEILVIKDLRINNLYDGANMQKQRLRYKKVLLVLDDVDHIDQLDALAGKREWFGPGSRIIVTTIDKHLLVKYDVEKIYRMRSLSLDESLKLFKLHAFKKNHPAKEFEDLSVKVIRQTAGLPLALKVLGSFLYGRDLVEWRSEVERLERIPEDQILKKLKLSFGGLNNIEQKIFLDIVCFFIGKKKESVTRILESFNFSPVIGIKVLMEKSMITISQGRILMHQLLQELGWYIIREEASDDPRRYSRLWLPENISHVLAGDFGTEKIEGISLHLAVAREVNASSAAFTQMSRLRFLKIQNIKNVCQGPNFLPGELRWLNWHEYPSKSLPDSFQGEKLVGLKLKDSRITQLWHGSKVLGKLKYINLSQSHKLVRTPDFSGTPTLERLVLEDCTSLEEIKFSARDLRRLVLLNLKNCRNLKTLPKSIQLENLEVFILSGCSKLRTFPEIKEKMDRLSELYLDATALKELPASVEKLSGVTLINLSYCKHLESLPSSIFRLKCLRTLALSGCSRLEKLSDDLGLLGGLEELYCDNTAIRTIPSSISLLTNLKHLSFHGCNALGLQVRSSMFSSWISRKGQNSTGLVFPTLSGLCSLTKLDISDCNILDGGILSNLGFLPSLEEVNLGRNNFTNIPASSINSLPRLKVLELVGCRRLEFFPELPPSVEEVYADECTSLMTGIDHLSRYPKLYRVSLTECHRLVTNKNGTAIVDPLWNRMLKGLTTVDDDFSICIPGYEIPEWFTYKNLGPSISVELPKNWYTNKFMGFALCVVYENTMGQRSCTNHTYLQDIPGFLVMFKLTRHDGKTGVFCKSIGSIGSERNLDSVHTLLAYASFDMLWILYQKQIRSPNDWTQIEVCRADKSVEIKGWGLHLLYENDIFQNSTSQSGNMGLFYATCDGSVYLKRKRHGNGKFSRLPPEEQGCVSEGRKLLGEGSTANFNEKAFGGDTLFVEGKQTYITDEIISFPNIGTISNPTVLI